MISLIRGYQSICWREPVLATLQLRPGLNLSSSCPGSTAAGWRKLKSSWLPWCEDRSPFHSGFNYLTAGTSANGKPTFLPAGTKIVAELWLMEMWKFYHHVKRRIIGFDGSEAVSCSRSQPERSTCRTLSVYALRVIIEMLRNVSAYLDGPFHILRRSRWALLRSAVLCFRSILSSRATASPLSHATKFVPDWCSMHFSYQRGGRNE